MPQPERAIVCGTVSSGEEPPDATVLLTPEDFGIPRRRCFTPTELAPYLMTSPMTVVRMIRDGCLRALPLPGGGYKIPYIEIVHFFMRQQGAMNYE
jgi:excisionase family DNA binding protein